MVIEGRYVLDETEDAITFTSSFVVTRFDLERRSATRSIRALFGLYRSTTTIPFGAIRSLGLREYNNDGYSYLPMITRDSGKRTMLAFVNGSALTIGPVIDRLCKRTGIAREDYKGSAWGW